MKIKPQSLELVGIAAVIAVAVCIRTCGTDSSVVSGPSSAPVTVTYDSVVPDTLSVKKEKAEKTRRHPVQRDFLDEKIERN